MSTQTYYGIYIHEKKYNIKTYKESSPQKVYIYVLQHMNKSHTLIRMMSCVAIATISIICTSPLVQ